MSERESPEVIEITVKLPTSEFRAIEQFKVIIHDDAEIGEMYMEAVLPMLTAMGYPAGGIAEGAREMAKELEYLIKEEESV